MECLADGHLGHQFLVTALLRESQETELQSCDLFWTGEANNSCMAVSCILTSVVCKTKQLTHYYPSPRVMGTNLTSVALGLLV